MPKPQIKRHHYAIRHVPTCTVRLNRQNSPKDAAMLEFMDTYRPATAHEYEYTSLGLGRSPSHYLSDVAKDPTAFTWHALDDWHPFP